MACQAPERPGMQFVVVVVWYIVVGAYVVAVVGLLLLAHHRCQKILDRRAYMYTLLVFV